MARATPTTTTPPTPSPARTTSPKRWGASGSTTRPSAASSARSGNGWTIGRSCGGRGEGSGRWRGEVMMNRRLEEAIARARELPEDRQVEAAEVLFAFLDTSDLHLTAEQIAQIERRLS